MKKVTTHEAKTHLSKLIEDVLSGSVVVICRGDEPKVKIVKYIADDAEDPRPKVGTITSKGIKYSKDCFSALEEKDLELWGS